MNNSDFFKIPRIFTLRNRWVSAGCWFVLATILYLAATHTSLGIRSTPSLHTPTGDKSVTIIELESPPRAPRHHLVRARLNGEAALFLLDTGTAETLLADHLLLENPRLQDSQRSILGALNQEWGRYPVVRVELLELGTHRFVDFDAMAVDLSNVEEALGTPIAGILGANILALQPFEIDFAERSLRLGRSRDEFEANLPLGARDSEIPFELIGNIFKIDARVGDTPVSFLLDTGADPSAIRASVDIDEAIHTEHATPKTGVDATNATLHFEASQTLRSIQVGGVLRRDFFVVRGDASLLGLDFFEGLTLWVDPQEGIAILRVPPSD